MILNKCLKCLLHWCLRSSRSNNNIDPVYSLVRNLLAESRKAEMTHRRESRKTPRSPYLWWWWRRSLPPPATLQMLMMYWEEISGNSCDHHTTWWTAIEGRGFQSFTPHYLGQERETSGRVSTCFFTWDCQEVGAAMPTVYVKLTLLGYQSSGLSVACCHLNLWLRFMNVGSYAQYSHYNSNSVN